MGKSALDIIGRVMQTASARWQSALPDRELLHRFAVANDQRAFAALFHRHAGMVLGVCRRVLPSVQDAEDACQATFVVLARKAKGGRWQPSIANWLYATARKVAANARLAARRRAQREGKAAAAEPVRPLDQLTSQELLTALDEELDRLPPRYREPLVLCYLQGLTRDEAAGRLSISVGTLKIRLERGRKRLAGGLTRRGCGLGAGLLALAATAPVQAAPLRLAGAVVAAVAGSPTPTVAALAEEVVMSGAIYKALALVAVVGVLTLGIGWAAVSVASPQPEQGTPQQTAPAARASAAPQDVARTDALGDPLPPGAVARLGTRRFRAGMWPKQIVATPDGRKLVTAGFNLSSTEYLTVWDGATGRAIRRVALPRESVQAMTVLPNGRGFAIVKISRDEYAVWEFTDEKASPPTATRPDEMNSSGNGTFAASAVSPDGKLLAGGERAGRAGNEGKLNVWPLVPDRGVRTLAPRWSVDMPGGFLGLAFTPDGKRLIGIVQQQAPSTTNRLGWLVPGQPAPQVIVFVWDAMTGKQVLTFNGPGGKELRTFKDAGPDVDPYETPAGLGRTLAIAPDGQTLYALNQEGRVAAIDLTTGKERFGFVAFAPGQSTLLPFIIDGLAITADGHTLIAVQRFEAIAGFDACTGKRLWQLRDEFLNSVHSLGVLPDGRRFVIGHICGSLSICEAATGKVLNEQPGHASRLTAVAVADDGRTALTSAVDRTICRWDLASGKQVRRTTLDALESFHVIQFGPDGQRAVAGWRDKEMQYAAGLIDVATGKVLAELPMTKSFTFPVTWLPDGSLIASDRPDKAFHFDRQGREVRSFKAPENRQVNTFTVSPDGKWLVLAGEGAPGERVRSSVGWLGLFDVQSGATKGIWEFPNRFRTAGFTPDGQAIVLGGDSDAVANALVLFDPVQRKIFTPFAVPDPQATWRYTDRLVMSPTGHQFAVADMFGKGYTITVYETASGAVRRQLRGHLNSVSQLAFTPDGQRLVSASRDGTGLVWDVALPRPEAAAAMSDADRRRCWQALGSTDDEAAYRALGELAANPIATVAFLKANLKATPPPSDAELDRLLERLDAAEFAERDAASRELHRLGTLVLSQVRDRLPRIASLDVQRRLEAFLQKHDWRGRLTGSRLRERRAIELLEFIGTPAARAVLQSTAESGNTPLARDAAQAAKRLGAR
ncbi:MAG: sigma-70 family RNA polymerase sigma factor [Planctomycetes bacterium]|nr:sigma-70 family RNA polymerase sigma factor [Planctomycetota bacterium]